MGRFPHGALLIAAFAFARAAGADTAAGPASAASDSTAAAMHSTTNGAKAIAPQAGASRRPVIIARHIDDPIHIDGALDEPAWADAQVISDFRLLVPREGEAPDESTAVRVLIEPERIVFGIWCSTRRPLRASLTPRDQILDGDHISMHVDTRGDGQRAYIFGVNPYGVELDGILTQDPDFKWDAVWDAAARRQADSWTAEIAVPFRAMRFPSSSDHPWRLWIRREITAWNEVSSWPLYRAGESGRIMLQAGDVAGCENVHSGRQLTVEPYVFGSLSGNRDMLPAGDLSSWSSDHSNQSGADVQAGLGSSLALNATYHPDFSQIEADALQIDLNRRFPLQYAEKRPFFLEGAENFATPLDLIYSRRMGSPRWGAKVTGRAGAINTGALFLRDDGGANLAGSGFGSSEDSAPGYFGISRTEVPFGRGSNAGILLGLHTQDGLAAVPADGFYHGGATLNHLESVDTQIKLSDHWSLEGQAAMTSTRSDSALSGGATKRQAFNDPIAVLRLNYRDHARSLQLGDRYVGPDFRNELGYQERIGVTYRHAVFGWDLFPKTGPLLRLTPYVDALVLHDHTGRPEYADINPYSEFLWRRNFFVIAGVHGVEEHWLNRNYSQQRAQVYIEDTRWRPLTWNLDTSIGDGIYYGATDAESFLAWTETYNLNVTVRPSPRVTAAANMQRLRVARRPASGDVLNETLLGVNTNAQFTRELSARFYPQYDSHTRHLALNGLIGYVLHPGTVLYLGLNSGFDEVASRQQPTGRQFFAKASYRLGI
ncbi:MAG TPA: DUF5916 domain-containing protein [Candidatus Udaeobacter sp.]|nr:DUF5916 domain-containing protein [Candidatus Udaeobacter sp.]